MKTIVKVKRDFDKPVYLYFENMGDAKPYVGKEKAHKISVSSDEKKELLEETKYLIKEYDL